MIGKLIKLEPLTLDHLNDLVKVGLDPAIWEASPRSIVTEDDLRGYVESAVIDAERGVSMPYAVILNQSGQAIGSTRYGNIDSANRRLEIGWTWIGRRWWRTGVNTECKILLLQNAFERLGCARVELKTDSINRRSRNAILRIGAQEEGTFRKHMLTASGRWRDTVYYSILDDEWPVVKKKLLEMMDRHG